MYFVITALVDPGDEVIYPNPGFPIYESVINFVGGGACRSHSGRRPASASTSTCSSAGVREDAAHRHQLAPESDGRRARPGQLGRIAEVARKYRIPVLADEIYKAFLYEGEFASITAFPG